MGRGPDIGKRWRRPNRKKENIPGTDEWWDKVKKHRKENPYPKGQDPWGSN